MNSLNYLNVNLKFRTNRPCLRRGLGEEKWLNFNIIVGHFFKLQRFILELNSPALQEGVPAGRGSSPPKQNARSAGEETKTKNNDK